MARDDKHFNVLEDYELEDEASERDARIYFRENPGYIAKIVDPEEMKRQGYKYDRLTNRYEKRATPLQIVAVASAFYFFGAAIEGVTDTTARLVSGILSLINIHLSENTISGISNVLILLLILNLALQIKKDRDNIQK